MHRFRLILALLILASAVAPATAFADPATSPETILSYDFEGADPTGGLAIGPLAIPQTSWWGRITSRAHSGTYGLWCAGVQDGTPVPAPNPFLYPGATYGGATINMTQTAELYSSTVDFWYTMPSLGIDDALNGSFKVVWEGTGSGTPSRSDWPLTGDGAWSQGSVPLGSYLSRRPGYVKFVFHDYITDSEVGQGATIDDIVVSGYKFGPVRSLVATQSGASTLLSWRAPPRALDDPSDETRAVAYRVWRSPGSGAPYSWAELTGARVTGRSFADSSAVLGGTYTYAVQAWDQGTGPGYGQGMALVTASTSDPLTFDKSVSTATVVANGTVTYSYAVTNSSAGTFTIGISDDKLGSILSDYQLAPFASRTTTRAAQLTTTTTNVGTLSAVDAYGRVRTKTDTAYVRVVGPSVSLTKVVDKPVVLQGTGVTYTYTIANTGGYDLTGVNLDDDKLGHVAGPIALNIGQSATYTRSATVTADVSNVATVAGVSAVMPVSASASATVDVIHPHVALTRSVDTSVQVAGGSVTHTLTVTNDGDVALSGVGIVDSQLGTVLTPRTLAPSASVTTVVVAPSVPGTVTYTAVASGTDALISTPVSSSAAVIVSRRTPAISIAKTADASEIPPNTLVAYTYDVTNAGDVSLLGGTVYDDTAGPVGTFPILVPGQHLVFVASQSLAVDTTNVATVLASYGTSGTAFSGTRAASATAFVDVRTPAISLTKAVSRPVVLPSTPVTFTYVVRNSGEATLSGVTLTDDHLGSVLPSSTLVPSQIVTITKSATITADATNIATASGGYRSRVVTAAASATVDVIHPHVALTRSVDTSVQVAGGSVTHTLTVTNDGDVALSGVGIVDSQLGTVLTPRTLAPSASVTTVVVAPSVPGTVTYSAVASGTDALISTPVSSSAAVIVSRRTPAISIAKTAGATHVVTGTVVPYTYVVRNTGDVTLADVLVTDDKIGPVVGAPALLAPSAQATLTAASLPLAADTTNVATVLASYGTSGTAFSGTHAASATAFVDVIAPEMSLSVNVSRQVVLPSTLVTYTYTVRNSGDHALTDVAVSTSGFGSVVSSCALGVGEATSAVRSAPIAAGTTEVASAVGKAGQVTLTAAATAAVDVIHPDLTLSRTVDTSQQVTGGSVVHSFTVANDGDVALAGVGITDGLLGTVLAGRSLSPGASVTTSVVGSVVVTSTYSATATAVDSLIGSPVSDTSTLEVHVRSPRLSLTKTADRPLVVSGTDVTYTYVVSNAGDTALRGVGLTDDKLGAVGVTSTLLLPGATQILTKSAPLSQDTTNLATATASFGTSGTSFYGQLAASAAESVEVIHPALSLAKAVSPSSVTLGQSVTYTFTLTNSGDTPIGAISLTDDVLGAVASGITLASGESTQVAVARTPSVSESGVAHATGHPERLPAATVSTSSAVVGVTVNLPPPPPPPPPAPTPDPAPAPVTPSLPGHTLYTPVAPSTVYYGRTFTMYGFLKPRHTAGLYSVKLEGYRYERQSNGTYKWVRRATWYAKNYNYSTYTKYIKAGNLKLRGKWKFRAVHTHTGYLPKYSAYRYLTVK